MNNTPTPLNTEPAPDNAEDRRMCDEAQAAWEGGDLPRAKALLLELATREIPAAQHSLGNLLILENPDKPAFAEAHGWLTRAAQQGYEPAFYSLGRIYANGEGVAASDAEALRCFVEGARRGSISCAEVAGEFFASGRAGEARHDLAIPMYQQAAEGGSPLAQRRLGFYYRDGKYLPKDDAKAIAFFEAAAGQGDKYAAATLGGIYEAGERVSVDLDRAIRWHAVAVEQGIETAVQGLGVCLGRRGDHELAAAWFHIGAAYNLKLSMISLGNIYQRGDGVAVDDELAEEWRAVAAQTENEIHDGVVIRATEEDRESAESAYLAAITLLARMYLAGQVVDSEPEKAASLCQLAAEHGNAEAQYLFGVLTESGLGCVRDHECGDEWIVRAAESGYAQAQAILSERYEQGVLREPDPARAAYWAERAAEQGSARGLFNLGTFYEHGVGVPQDYEQAFSLYERAAQLGEVSAALNLGVLYENGWGVEPDRLAAIDWYTRAASHGHVRAKVNLAALLLNNDSRSRDDEALAAQLLQDAANEGLPEAQFNLGKCYESGNGVAEDLAAAIGWYEKAAGQGFYLAQYRLASLLASTGDLVTALVWYCIFQKTMENAGSGEIVAGVQKEIEALRARMTSQHLEEAEEVLKG
jgi:TPR repeat protein